jgi:hypothetical protein
VRKFSVYIRHMENLNACYYCLGYERAFQLSHWNLAPMPHKSLGRPSVRNKYNTEFRKQVLNDKFLNNN